MLREQCHPCCHNSPSHALRAHPNRATTDASAHAATTLPAHPSRQPARVSGKPRNGCNRVTNIAAVCHHPPLLRCNPSYNRCACLWCAGGGTTAAGGGVWQRQHLTHLQNCHPRPFACSIRRLASITPGTSVNVLNRTITPRLALCNTSSSTSGPAVPQMAPLWPNKIVHKRRCRSPAEGLQHSSALHLPPPPCLQQPPAPNLTEVAQALTKVANPVWVRACPAPLPTRLT